MRFSRRARVASSRNSSAPIPWTLAATAGAGAASAPAWAEGAPALAPAAVSSCLEHAPSAAASSRQATNREPGGIVKVICTPPWWNPFDYGIRLPVSRRMSPIVNRASAAHKRSSAAPARLLADAEAGEDVAQQFVGGEAAGEAAQRVVGQAQLFGGQLQLPGLQLQGRGVHRLQGTAQRLQVAGARAELALGRLRRTAGG